MANRIVVFFLVLLFTSEELLIINTRRSYYPTSWLGKIFENKLEVTTRRIEYQVFKYLDINKYLFASHPRENE